MIFPFPLFPRCLKKVNYLREAPTRSEMPLRMNSYKVFDNREKNKVHECKNKRRKALAAKSAKAYAILLYSSVIAIYLTVCRRTILYSFKYNENNARLRYTSYKRFFLHNGPRSCFIKELYVVQYYTNV